MRFFNNKSKIYCNVATSTHKDAVVAGALLVLANKFAVTDFFGIAEPVGMNMKELMLDEIKNDHVDFVQVIVRCEGINQILLWNRKGSTTSFIWDVRKRFLGASITVQLGGKPVREGVPCFEYDVQNGSSFTAYRPRLGGASSLTFDDILFSQNTWTKYELGPCVPTQRLQKQFREKRKFELWQYEKVITIEQPQLQARSSEEDRDLHKLLKERLDEDVVSLVEDLALLLIQMLRAPTSADRLLALVTFCKLRSGKSLVFSASSIISDVYYDLAGPEMQADDSTQRLLDGITDFRGLLDNWEALRTSTLVKKFAKIYKFAIAMGVFTAMGIEVDKVTIALCKKEVGFDILGANFLVSILDAISLVIQRALMFKQSGEWSTFFHGPKAYGEWYDKCMELKRNSQFMGDLKAVGTSYPEFVKGITVAIEQGNAILRYGEKTAGFEIKAIKGLLNDLKLIQANVSTYDEAQKSRRPPFALLVHSNSSLAKSTFVEMLFKFMGQVWDLPADDTYKYPRNSAEPFWSGWNSSKWFILLDDIAYINPNRNEPDTSLMEMIQLINDVPLVPNQAALEDKGKNPVRARAVIATTNIKGLNAHARFSCPLAVQRRLPFVVNLYPKEEYARKDSPGMIDPRKLPPIVDDWPNFWNIMVERVDDAGDGFAKHTEIKYFTEVNDFLDWLRMTMEDFDTVQQKASRGCSAMLNFKLCKDCNRVKCICTEGDRPAMQASETILPIDVGMGEDYERTHFEEPNLVFRDSYKYLKREDTNYVRTTHCYRDGELLYKTTAYVNVVLYPKQMQTEETVSYADILAKVVELQAERTGGWMAGMAKQVICRGLHAYTSSRTVRNIVNSAMEWKVCRKLTMFFVQNVAFSDNNTRRKLYVFIGELARQAYMTPRWKIALAGISAVTVLAGAYYVVRKTTQQAPVQEFTNHVIHKGEVYCKHDQIHNCVEPADVEEEPRLQGGRVSVEDSFFKKTEKENVWKRDDYEVSTFDMTPLNIEYSKLPGQQLAAIVRRNVARIRVSNGTKVKEGNAFCVGGHLWVTNAHTFYRDEELNVQLNVQPMTEGTTPNAKFKLRQTELLWDEDHDMVWFQVFCWETKRDLRSLIAKPMLNVRSNGLLVGFDKTIHAVENRVDAIVQTGPVMTPGYAHPIDGWAGWARAPTNVGDCGMPLLTIGSPCAAIVGLHMMGTPSGQVWATRLTTELVDKAVMHFEMPILQCRVPQISGESKKKNITGLRPWSPLRWVEEGSLRVFGSYDEYQPTPRSKVTKTLLSDIIIKEKNWEVDAAVPQMKDWRPWRHALVDVVQQKHGSIDTSKLKQCARAFADDILDGLSPKQLEEIQVLSDKATINGIPGVKFIDKMNFKSSIGEPYRRAKKHYLRGPIGDKIFDPEIQARIDDIIRGYEDGICSGTIFGGQIKDEVRPHKKVDLGKLRIFLSGAGDWCFVVRKYLLTTVKLMQENPFLFECSPGCAAQSAEWEQYYDFLTQFGRDRMIAGDYGSFDKNMEAILILMAFWVLIQVHKKAGWTDEECLPLWCIAEDTAYAYCNFGGDLVQFFGSNPSGHPLTVIINCLVNALYMRYCFAELCPDEGSTYDKARKFKQFVALLTYGDDNTMGVSRKIDWFNHTAIQKVLASIGVKYTMADKEAESRPFIDIREVSYLKRKWRWDEDIGAVVCPLEESSIHKMLTWCVPSGEESAEFHMASVMVSAANEWFWYGKQKFEEEREWLVNLAAEHGILRHLEYKKMPTWDELYTRYWKASEGIETNRSRGCVSIHPRDVVA